MKVRYLDDRKMTVFERYDSFVHRVGDIIVFKEHEFIVKQVIYFYKLVLPSEQPNGVQVVHVNVLVLSKDYMITIPGE